MVMAITKQISIRLDETVLAEVDAEALRLGVSRNLVISRRVEKLPPLYSVDRESGVISIVPENGESRKKIADDSAGVVGENPACAPMGKRELPDNIQPLPDKQAALAKLRGLVAGIENNVMITPTMGADGNFVEICPVCGGRGIIDGCPECGLIINGDQEENNLPRCSHVERCEDGENYSCARELGHKGKCIRGERVEE